MGFRNSPSVTRPLDGRPEGRPLNYQIVGRENEIGREEAVFQGLTPTAVLRKVVMHEEKCR
jgi:hypothetical protein